ncbi:hypothetical protein HYR54_10035 [Candidatus Acetothermia bacterium]|nr:hypothetical protein [Candidatus Acetothermia bacterium]
MSRPHSMLEIARRTQVMSPTDEQSQINRSKEGSTMKYIKKNAGLLRSVRSWGVLGLVLALAVAVGVGYEQTLASQAQPQPQTSANDQTEHHVFVEEKPEGEVFLEPMVKPVNPISPSSHPLLGSGWAPDNDHSDEFNSLTLDTSKWIVDYGWANTFTHHLAYNRTCDVLSCVNHQFYTGSGNGYLRLVTQKENYSGKVVDYVNSDEILSDGRPNYRMFEYTSAMIRSKTLISRYGFIEIRARIPNSRYVIADFWLFNSNSNPVDPDPYFYQDFRVSA